MDDVVEGKMPRIVTATKLRSDTATTLGEMKENMAQTVLGGPTDPRVKIEGNLSNANDQLAGIQDRHSPFQKPVTQTSAGRATLEDIAGEVGYQLSPVTSVPTTPTILQKIVEALRGK